jgi:hypothetical protein
VNVVWRGVAVVSARGYGCLVIVVLDKVARIGRYLVVPDHTTPKENKNRAARQAHYDMRHRGKSIRTSIRFKGPARSVKKLSRQRSINTQLQFRIIQSIAQNRDETMPNYVTLRCASDILSYSTP